MRTSKMKLQAMMVRMMQQRAGQCHYGSAAAATGEARGDQAPPRWMAMMVLPLRTSPAQITSEQLRYFAIKLTETSINR